MNFPLKTIILSIRWPGMSFAVLIRTQPLDRPAKSNQLLQLSSLEVLLHKRGVKSQLSLRSIEKKKFVA